MRSSPQGKLIQSPGSGIAVTLPKRRTTARSPGLIGFTPVRSEAVSDKPIIRRIMRLVIYLRAGPIRNAGKQEEYIPDFSCLPGFLIALSLVTSSIVTLLLLSLLFLRFRRFEQEIEHIPVTVQQQHRFVVSQYSLILLQLLQKRTELRILAVGEVADAVGFSVGLAFNELFGGFGVGHDVAGFQLGLALDLGSEQSPLALVIGDFPGPLAADAGE